MSLYRHGDVLVAEVKALPEDARPVPGLVLARGEVTGHSHRVETKGLAELYEHGDALYLRVVGQMAHLVHEEHATLDLPPGNYRVWRQREYTGEREASSRYVED